MDEIATKEQMEFLHNFLYNFLDICDVVGNLSPNLNEVAQTFIDKIEEFYETNNEEIKKINLHLLKDLMEGEVSLEIKHREPIKIINPDISLIPEGAYCYDEKHVCPYRNRLYYTHPLNSLIECKYLGIILKDDPSFGDEVKICDVKNTID